MDTPQLISQLLGKNYLRKKPLFKSNPLQKLVKRYYDFYEEFNLDKKELLQDLLKIENPKTMSILEAYDQLVRELKRPSTEDDYKQLQDNFLILANRYEDLELTKTQIDSGIMSAISQRAISALDPDLRAEAMNFGRPPIEDLSVEAPLDEEVIQVAPQQPLPQPERKPSLRGSSGAGAGGGSGGAGTPRVTARVRSVTPRKSPKKVDKQVEPIVLPPSEQPPPPPSSLPTIPEDGNPLSVPIPQEVEPEPNIPMPQSQPSDPMTPPPPPPAQPAQPPVEPAQPPLEAQQAPNMADMATKTEPNVSQEISRKVTSVSNEEQPSKIDLIPKERLSAENKTEAELFDDINYFYKTFPNELKNITFDRNNRNIEYLKSKHKEIVAKLTAGKKKEEKIGIIISGSDYIKEKLKEIILENSINGLSAKDLIINIEKKENEQSSDVNSYEFKMGADGKAMAKKEPIYKYIPEVVQQPIKTKPSRIPNTQTKFRSLVTTARREVANNPFTKPQPKIRLKYTY
jgi:hypothetical protein